MDRAVATYDAWAAQKGVLEGPSDLKRRIRGAGVLEFIILAERDPGNPGMTGHSQGYLQESIAKYVEQLEKRGPRPSPGDVYRWIEVVDAVAFTSLDSLDEIERTKSQLNTILEKYAGKWHVLAHAEQKFGLLRDAPQKWKLEGAFVGVDGKSGGPAVNFELDPRGGSQFARLTSENINRPLCILLDNMAQSYANIASMIREHGQISGRSYTPQDVQDLISTLRAGSLPARLIA